MKCQENQTKKMRAKMPVENNGKVALDVGWKRRT